MSDEEIINGLRTAVVSYDEEGVRRLANIAIEKGIDLLRAIQEGLVFSLSKIITQNVAYSLLKRV